MGILNMKPADRRGSHVLISFYGGPEGGKTYSALLMAAGIEPDPKKRILLDTENGRGSFYFDEIPGGYDYAELTRPFTPERYTTALREIEAAGYTVCVLDSVSHVWFGEGGVLESADLGEKAGKKGQQKWLDPKLRHRKFTNTLLSTRMHIITCSRAKQPMLEIDKGNGRKEMVRGEWVEIQDKSLRFEHTMVLEVSNHGEFVVKKCPGALKSLMQAHPKIGVEAGQALAKWVAGGGAVDLALEKLRRDASDAADEGSEALKTFWDALSKENKALLKPSMDNYKSMAKAADDERERQKEGAAADPSPEEQAAIIEEEKRLAEERKA